MTSAFGSSDRPQDPFTQFWGDFMRSVAPPGSQPPQQMVADFGKQMRSAFFEQWAKYCDEFFRSEQFLGSMKQSMDNAMVFKKQVDQFLTESARGLQIPAKADADQILVAIKSIEERLLGRLAELGDRVERLEGTPPGKASATRARAATPAKKTPGRRAVGKRAAKRRTAGS